MPTTYPPTLAALCHAAGDILAERAVRDAAPDALKTVILRMRAILETATAGALGRGPVEPDPPHVDAARRALRMAEWGLSHGLTH